MIIVITVTAEIEHSEGKFASRDELTEKILGEIESADPSSIDTDDGATYEITSWEVSETEPPKRKRA